MNKDLLVECRLLRFLSVEELVCDYCRGHRILIDFHHTISFFKSYFLVLKINSEEDDSLISETLRKFCDHCNIRKPTLQGFVSCTYFSSFVLL